MSKVSVVSRARVFAGVDVSAKTLAVAVQREGKDGFEQREFANSKPGRRQLIAWLRKSRAQVRVALEATGTYSLDVALALDGAVGIEVAVLNPKTANRFAQTLGRSKTDQADAVALSEYSLRMRFAAWRRPSGSALELRQISRYIAALAQEHTRAHNRLHAAQASETTPRCVREDLKRSMADLKKRIAELRRKAVAMVRKDAELASKLEQLTSIPGIAETSAVQLLGELAGLDPEMTVRQWVAHSGLDPAHRQSGSSVHKPSRISRHGNRHLRRALYMPALVGVRFDPHMKAFYTLLQARHKTKLQALMAVARKLLHAIFGIFKTNTPYDGRKLFPELLPA
ncbi:MAG TPA: IS110 family transposase [Acidobacteriaceae bacterium]|nr:IS110 family transposase [Acidobacteriaceae bacterium]